MIMVMPPISICIVESPVDVSKNICKHANIIYRNNLLSTPKGSSYTLGIVAVITKDAQK